MPSPIEASINSLDEDLTRRLLHALHKSLEISVDFDSYDRSGLQFWAQLESDLIKALRIASMGDVKKGRRNLSHFLGKVLEEEQISLTYRERASLLSRIFSDYFGFGVLDVLLEDDSIYRILINNFQEIYFKTRGKLQRSPFSFRSDSHYKHVIDRLCIRNSITLPTETDPIRACNLSDSSSVTIVLPPVTPNSPLLSIDKPIKTPLTIDQLIQFGSMSVEMLQFIKISVEAGLNILVCGHQGSGATTLLNILSSFIPGNERVVSIEHESNYSLKINHLIKLMAQEGPEGEFSYARLLNVARKLRPDRLVLGEFLPSETYDVLNAINDHFTGCILKVVAKSPTDAVHRLEAFMQMDKPTLPYAGIRELFSSSIDLIIYQERLVDGSRVIKNIVEVADEINHDRVVLRDIFGFEQVGIKDGRILKNYPFLGYPSEKIMNKIENARIEVPSSLFASGVSIDKNRELSETDKRAIKFSKGKYAFISYSKDDRSRVRTLAGELENIGFDVWLDVLDIKPGEEWTKVLESAIRNAGAFLVILTPSAASSPFVRNEIAMAQDEKLPIIPVKMEECDIPIQIRALQYMLYDRNDVDTSVSLISETLSKYISNKQLVIEV